MWPQVHILNKLWGKDVFQGGLVNDRKFTELLNLYYVLPLIMLKSPHQNYRETQCLSIMLTASTG
jgi:hypothetical protein